jgi:hypothetical protein
MVYVEQNSQNFSGFFPSSGIPKNTTFRKLDLFPSWGEGGEKTPIQLGPLERANLNHHRSSFRNVVFFWNTGRWKKSRKILWILFNIHLRQNHFKSTYLVVCTRRSLVQGFATHHSIPLFHFNCPCASPFSAAYRRRANGVGSSDANINGAKCLPNIWFIIIQLSDAIFS